MKTKAKINKMMQDLTLIGNSFYDLTLACGDPKYKSAIYNKKDYYAAADLRSIVLKLERWLAVYDR